MDRDDLVRSTMDRCGLTQAEARSLLAKFGLGAEHVTRPVGTLSPGERTRAELAAFQALGVNLLVLDEPTNHLDLPAIEQLEAALAWLRGDVVAGLPRSPPAGVGGGHPFDRASLGVNAAPSRGRRASRRRRLGGLLTLQERRAEEDPMIATVTEAWRTVVPPAGDRHGPLAPLLLTADRGHRAGRLPSATWCSATCSWPT